MAYTVLASDLITRIRRTADAETPTPATDFVTDTELLVELNAAYREFLDLVISSGDAATELLATSATLTSPFTLPADLYRLIAVDLPDVTQAGRWLDAKSFNFRDRNDSSYFGLAVPRYRLVGQQLMFQTVQQPPTTCRVWYVPISVDVTLPSGTLTTFNGWQDYLVHTVAMYVCGKENRDMGPHTDARKRAEDRIREACANLVVDGTQTMARVEFQPEEFYSWYGR